MSRGPQVGPRAPGFSYNPDNHPWRELRQCRDTDPAIFFPDAMPEATSSSSEGVPPHSYAMQVIADKRERWAVAVCDQCPVQSECLEDSLLTREQFGIRGGKTPRQRRRILAKRGVHLKLTGRDRHDDGT